MVFEVGNKYGSGRPKGSVNATTLNARQALADFIEGNVWRLNSLLDDIREENGPKAAFDSLMSVMEYHLPKLNRSEIKTEKGLSDISGQEMQSLYNMLMEERDRRYLARQQNEALQITNNIVESIQDVDAVTIVNSENQHNDT